MLVVVLATGALALVVAPCLSADLIASASPVPAKAPANDPDGAESSAGENLIFRVNDGKLLGQWVGDVKGYGVLTRVRRPTAKLAIRAGGTMRNPRGGGELVFVNVLRQGVASGAPAGSYTLRVPKGAARVVQFNAQNLHTPAAGTYNIDFTGSASGGMRVVVSQVVFLNTGHSTTVLLDAAARNFHQLYNEHPQAVRTFVAPALLELTGIECFPPGAGDVYAAFDKLRPDPLPRPRSSRRWRS